MFELAISTVGIISYTIIMPALRDFTPFPSKSLEQFFNEVHAFVQRTVMGDDIGGVAHMYSR